MVDPDAAFIACQQDLNPRVVHRFVGRKVDGVLFPLIADPQAFVQAVIAPVRAALLRTERKGACPVASGQERQAVGCPLHQ